LVGEVSFAIAANGDRSRSSVYQACGNPSIILWRHLNGANAGSALEQLLEIINELSSFLNQQLPRPGGEMLDNVTAAGYSRQSQEDA
jgi:hypothetical protein